MGNKLRLNKPDEPNKNTHYKLQRIRLEVAKVDMLGEIVDAVSWDAASASQKTIGWFSRLLLLNPFN